MKLRISSKLDYIWVGKENSRELAMDSDEVGLITSRVRHADKLVEAGEWFPS